MMHWRRAVLTVGGSILVLCLFLSVWSANSFNVESLPGISSVGIATGFMKKPVKQSPATSKSCGNRNVLVHVPWPEKQLSPSRPSLVPPTVHYLWCGPKRKFLFQHYLAVLSAIRVLRPTKLVFHYTHLPTGDNYNTWFTELKTSFLGLELREVVLDPSKCGHVDTLNTLLGFLAPMGGYYIGSTLLLARPPPSANEKTGFWFAAPPSAADKTQCFVAVTSGFDQAKQASHLKTIVSGEGGGKCEHFSSYTDSSDCVALVADLLPRHIVNATTPFGELARWLYYGKRDLQVPVQDPSQPIPRVAHFIKLENKAGPGMFDGLYRGELSFSHFLSILSALYVGGFQQVYLHVEKTPHGKWWDELKGEKNITVLPIDRPHSVFQKHLGVIQHVSDILRYLVLYKYGGAYQDFDVIWSSRVPDWLLNYPAVIGIEWTRSPKNPEFPEIFNIGVMMARAESAWFGQQIAAQSDYRDDDWGFNGGEMAYRVWEWYPQSLYIDRHLQVSCFARNPKGMAVTCHPTWDPLYQRSIIDSRPTMAIKDWRSEVRSFHMTQPKPHPSQASLEAIRNGKDIFADVARNVLIKSGRQGLLNG